MGNLLDYVSAHAKKTFAEWPLNSLDIACLNELGYLRFGEAIPVDIQWGSFVVLSDLVAQVDTEQLAYDFLVTPFRVALCQAVVASRRFKGLEIGFYINDVDPSYDKQFAAMVMQLPAIGHRQLIFRGTDDSLIGWKEDCQMSYMRTIPAQQAALTYLRTLLKDHPEPLVISGHSKGGNLALYASSFLPSELQDIIQTIYVFDAPGLHQSVLQSTGYHQMRDRVEAFRPEQSIVGMVLESDLPYKTVVSQGIGFMQHDMRHWQVGTQGFEQAEQLSQMSLSLRATLADWIEQHSNQDLKRLVDTLFDLFFMAGIDSLNDLNTHVGEKVKAMLWQFSDLSKPQKELLAKAVGDFLSLYQKHTFEHAWSEFLGKWQRQKDDSDEVR